MQRRDGLLTLYLRLVSNVAGELKNGVSKPVPGCNRHCRRRIYKPAGGRPHHGGGLRRLQLHATHGDLFSKVA